MATVPASGQSLLVRTDFADDEAWSRVRAAATAESEEGFVAYVVLVEDTRNDGASWLEIRDAVLDTGDTASVLFIADATTMASAEAPILVVDLSQLGYGQRGPAPFRCIAAELWGVDNNLNISNMDWEDFADNLDPDGIFRSFPS